MVTYVSVVSEVKLPSAGKPLGSPPWQDACLLRSINTLSSLCCIVTSLRRYSPDSDPLLSTSHLLTAVVALQYL
jgi:hypothetical protein